MRVVTGAEMRALDQMAAQLGLPTLALMEAAGARLADAAERAVRGRRAVVVCGGGNNGGDGFVAARHLQARGWSVSVWLAAPRSRLQGDAAVNAHVWSQCGPLEVLAGDEPTAPGEPGPKVDERFERALAGADVIIDALLGTGVRGAPRPMQAAIIQAINAASVPVIAADIPSGVNADDGSVPAEAVRAQRTVTFGLPKRGVLLRPGAEYAGEIEVADIGLPAPLLAQAGHCEWVLPLDAARRVPHRPADAHKGTFGRVVLVGGSVGLAGAIYLSTLAALRAGCGLALAAVPASLQPVVASMLPGALTLGLAEDGGALTVEAQEAVAAQGADVVALGPGLGSRPAARELARRLLRTLAAPLVVDADGLNALAEDPAWQAGRPPRTAPWVLTPHPGEAARLLATTTRAVQADRIGAAQALAQRSQGVVVLKGNPTLVAAGDALWINSTGNAGLAQGGSGDVLTGVIAALLAQGLAPADAAVLGVYWHGAAADWLAQQVGPAGYLASAVADALPRTRRWLERGERVGS